VTPTLDENIVQRVNDLGSRTWSGTTYRHVARGRDFFAGAGALMFGGRWNPKGSFPVVYLAQPVAACMGELERLAQPNSVSVAEFLRARRALGTIDVHELAVLDLRTDDALTQVGLDRSDIDDDDWTACQTVGHAAHFLNFGGVLAPSATGVGLVLAAFENRVAPGQLTLRNTEPLTVELFHRSRLSTPSAD